MNGVVSRVFPDKGYGFIKGEDGKEYFFHRSALKNIAFTAIQKDAEVTFEDADTAKGLRAEDIYA